VVRPLATDLYHCPDGLLADPAVLVVSADNRRADIGANRLAARMRSRLLKVNLEPQYNLISLRAYDFRHGATLCCECQFTDQMYLNQRHPNSCEADPRLERRTAAPRWLSAAAGAAAALVLIQLVNPDSARRWIGRQWQWMCGLGDAQWSELSPSPTCRWDHGAHWPNLVRLGEGPRQLTLRNLFRLAAAHPHQPVQLRFCQQVVKKLGCDRCGRNRDTVLWVNQVNHPAGSCGCGGELHPISFWTYRQIAADELRAVFDRPLADWGVPSYAVIEITQGTNQHSFVVGTDAGGGLSLEDAR